MLTLQVIIVIFVIFDNDQKSYFADMILKLKIDPNLVWFSFGYKSLFCLYEL